MGTQLVVPVDSSNRTARYGTTQWPVGGGGYWGSTGTYQPWPGYSVPVNVVPTPSWPGTGGTLKSLAWPGLYLFNGNAAIGLNHQGCWKSWLDFDWTEGYVDGSAGLELALAQPNVTGALVVETIGVIWPPRSGYVLQHGENRTGLDNGVWRFVEATVLGAYAP